MHITIIAEAGVNHNGSIATAKKMIEAAKRAGADYIKFQTFCAEQLVSKNTQKAEYQKRETGSEETQLQMLQKLELSAEDFRELQLYCKQLDIGFLSTPFDSGSICLLKEMGMDFWKIPSGEISNYPYLVQIAETNMPVIMSTGMSTLQEIKESVKVLQDHGCNSIKLLHCNTEYPTPFQDVNLAAMQTLRNQFGLMTGYSDHTEGVEISIAAAALGACVIEKHFTLDRNMEGPDHRASLEPDELIRMIQAIRHIEQAIGDGCKRPTESEMKNRLAARKSIVAKKLIYKGEYFTENNITAKRPGNGISPMRWQEIIGQQAGQDYEEDELIQE